MDSPIKVDPSELAPVSVDPRELVPVRVNPRELVDPKAAMRTAAPAGGALKSAVQMSGRHPIPEPPGGFRPEDPANVYWRDERAKYSKLPAAERALTGAATAATRLASGVAGLAPFEIPGFTDKQGKDTLALMDYMTHGDLPSAAGGITTDAGVSLL